MPESEEHLRLVRSICEYIAREYAHVKAIAVFDDSPAPTRGEKPPRINGFVPDVYAVDVPTSITIIGEAKTQSDLEKQHSRDQLAGFLEFLALRPRGVLVVAVPWQALATAKTVVASVNRLQGPALTKVVFLDEVGTRASLLERKQ